MTTPCIDHVAGLELYKQLCSDRHKINLSWAELLDETIKQAKENGPSTTSPHYKAELYDEVWSKAREMGFSNVTEALLYLEKLGPLLHDVLEAAAFLKKCKSDSSAYETGAYRDADSWRRESSDNLAKHLNDVGFIYVNPNL